MSKIFMRPVAGLAFLGLAAMGLVRPAAATTVERVVSPGGIEAWLVQEHSIPVIALQFAVRGGAAQDPADKAGTAYLTASTLDEGAGDLDSHAFQERMQRLGVELTFSANRDTLTGSLRVLTSKADASFDLLRVALTSPRFDQDAVDRVRNSILSSLARQETDPNSVAARTFSALAFANHPYGRPTNGAPSTIASLTREDLIAYHHRIVTRDTLKVAVVGDIDGARLGAVLDKIFGALPAKGELAPVPNVVPSALGTHRIVDLNVPQTVIEFGLPAMPRKDPDFMAATVVNHILGGGSFSSRLWTEVREKRGLTYGIQTYLSPLDHTSAFLGLTSVRNEKVGEALSIIEAEIKRMAAEGPTEAELNDAKTYLTGSYLLRFDTSTKVAGQLLAIQLDDLGIDYIDRRNAEVNAVTIEDAKRVAKRLLSGDPLVVLVGRPTGVTARGE